MLLDDGLDNFKEVYFFGSILYFSFAEVNFNSICKLYDSAKSIFEAIHGED
mgnify:CR=1 FL=1